MRGPGDVSLLNPRLIRPSLGHPFFISADEPVFTALVGAPRSGMKPAALKSGFRMTAVHDRHLDLELETVSVDGSQALPGDSPFRQVLFPEENPSFHTVELAVPDKSSLTRAKERRFILFNLGHPHLETSRHSLVWINHKWEDARFIFVADTHISTAWEQIEADLRKLDPAAEDSDPRHPHSLQRFFSRPAFEDTFVNPNGNLQSFIQEANDRAARGELDFVILGGDLVDYQALSQFEFFERIVTGRAGSGPELEVPLFTVPGNHDYRRHPYRIQAYPLDRCGFHNLQKDFFLKKARGESIRRFSLKDAKAVLGEGGKGHPLADYLLRINPETDFTLKIGRTKIVFLDTGPDVFRNLRRIHPRRWKNYVRALPHNWLFPSSSGLRDDQVEFLSREASDGDFENLILIFHAGLANPLPCRIPNQKGKSQPEADQIQILSSGDTRFSPSSGNLQTSGSAMGSRIRIENELIRSGLSRGGLFQNQLFLLRAAAVPGRRVLGLSGHFHRTVAVQLEKKTGILFTRSGTSNDFSAERAKHSSFLFSSGPLGHLQFRFDPPGRPEYIFVEIEGQTISSVKSEKLPIDPFDTFWIRAREMGSSPPGISIIPEYPFSIRENRVEDPTLNLSFLIFAKPVKNTSGGFPFKIAPASSAGVAAGQPEWIPERERKEYFGRRRPAYLQSFQCDLKPEWVFRFYPEGYFRRRTPVVVLAELVSREDQNRERRKIFWYPLSVYLRVRSGTDAR